MDETYNRVSGRTREYQEAITQGSYRELRGIAERASSLCLRFCATAKGYVHRLLDHGKGEYSYSKGNHINGLEGFWGYLKKNLTSKGGVRREKSPLYLAEFVWRYNNRNLGVDERVNSLLTLLYNFSLKYIN